MNSHFQTSQFLNQKKLSVITGLLLLAIPFALSNAVAQQTQGLIENCIDEVSGPNNCSANDTNLTLLIIANPDDVVCSPVADEPGAFEATVFMQAKLNSTAANRYDLGIFIAEDGGDARTGACHRNYLPAEPDALSAGGTCSITAATECEADGDCPDGETCVGLYDPGEGTFELGGGPFLDAEDVEPPDLCGDLEQGVDTYYDLLRLGHCIVSDEISCAFDRECPGEETCVTDGDPDDFDGGYAYDTVTIRCEDQIDDQGAENPDGYVDVATCVSWDNTKNNLCENVFDTVPNTVAKCNCSRSNTTLPMPGFLTLVKQVVNDNGGSAGASEWTLSATAQSGDGSMDISDEGTPNTGDSEATVGPSVIDPDVIYDLAESGGPSGYDDGAGSASEFTCTFDVGSGTFSAENQTIDLDPGAEASCTIINNDQLAILTLDKIVVNDNGGSAAESAWTLTATGTGSEDPASISGAGAAGSTDVQSGSDFDAGTYDLSESTGPSGYSPSSWSCTEGQTGSNPQVTVNPGDDITCTITNTDDPPSLTLTKQVTNNNGGTASAGDWTLSAAGYNPANPQTGTYDLSETGPANYSLTSLTCDNATGQVSSVTLGLGENVSCTFVNDDDPPSLTLTKQVTNNNGGTASAGDWTLSAAGYNPANPQTGTYDLSETGPANYSLTSLTCDNATGQVSSVTLGLGENVSCTFVNADDPPSLTLTKQVTNNNGGTASAGDWTLSAAGYNPADPQTGTYDLSETGPANYSLTSLTCDNATGQVSSVTLGLGENVSCTFVNADDPPSLTLTKQVTNNNGGTASAGDWTLSAAGYNPADPQTGTYDLSETGPANYSLTSLTCDNATGQVSSVTLGLGENVSCTFVNDDDPPSLTVSKVLIPNADTGRFNLQIDGSTAGTGGNVGHGGSTGAVVVNAGAHTVGETAMAGTDLADYLTVISGSCDASGNVVLTLGSSASCTITNTLKGRVDVTKTVSGSFSSGWHFEIRTGVSLDAVGSTIDTCTTDGSGSCDFGDDMFAPGDYWFCESGMFPGWRAQLSDFLGAIVPNGNSQDVDNSIICAPFTLDPGETESFLLSNTPPPEGDARTIGFWKNWTSCDGHGNQDAVLDLYLPEILGNLLVDRCEVAVDLLDKREIKKPDVVKDGKKRAGDAAYALAAQLLAYELNYNAGAATCEEASQAADDGQALLSGIGFDGTGSPLKGKQKKVLAEQANALAGTLDLFNNNLLCTDP